MSTTDPSRIDEPPVGDVVLVITDEQVAALGNVDDALALFYIEQIQAVAEATGVSERDIRTWFEDQLINDQGFRAQVLEGPGAAAGPAVLRLLVDGHLLRTESRRGAIWYELAHDRLIRPVLDDNARWRLEHLSRLQETASRWGRQGRPGSMLLVGQDLVEAEAWAAEHDAELVGVDRDFLEASQRAEQQRALIAKASHRRRVAAGSVVVIALLASAVVALAVLRRVDEDRRDSERLASRALAVLDGDPTQAARIGLEAWDVSHTALAEEAVRRASSLMMVERTVLAHDGAIVSVSAAPDGDRLLTTSEDGTARLWDAADGTPLLTLEGHGGPVWDGRFLDDARVATWSIDHTIRIWDVATEEELHRLSIVPTFPNAIVSSPDGRRIAATIDARTVAVWDTTTGAVLARLAAADVAEAVVAVAFVASDPDVLVVASSSASGGAAVRAWSVSAGAVRTEMPRPSWDPHPASLAVSADGATVAVGTTDGYVLFWRWQETLDTNWFRLPVDSAQRVEVLSFSADGRSLLASAEKVTALLLDDEDTWSLAGHVEHTDWALSSAFDPGGEFFASVSRDGAAIVGDVRSASTLAELRGHIGQVADLVVLPDGRITTVGGDGTLRLWRVPGTEALLGHDDWVIGLDVAGDRTTAVSAGVDRKVVTWDLATQQPLVEITTGFPMQNAAISDDAGVVAATDLYGDVTIWDVSSGSGEALVNEVPMSASDVAFSPGGRLLAVAMGDGNIALWDWRSVEPIVALSVGGGAAFVEWSPDGSRLATGLADGRVVVWDPAAATVVQTMRGHIGQVWDVAFSADGRFVASAGQDRTARVWDVESGTELQRLLGHDIRLSAVAFGSDDVVVTGDSAGMVGVWDRDSGVNLSLARVHGRSVNGIEVLADGTVLSAGDDRALRLSRCESCLPMSDLVPALERRLGAIPEVTAAPVAPLRPLATSAPGTCTPDLPEDVVERMEVVDCEQPHRYELYATLVLPEARSTQYPGSEALFGEANSVCADAFEGYVGAPVSASRYLVQPFVPTAEAWEAGSRKVSCFLTDPDGQSTGSAEGAQR